MNTKTFHTGNFIDLVGGKWQRGLTQLFFSEGGGGRGGVIAGIIIVIVVVILIALIVPVYICYRVIWKRRRGKVIKPSSMFICLTPRQ